MTPLGPGPADGAARSGVDDEAQQRREGDSRESLIRQGQRLEYFTIGYNSIEGIVAVVAGLIAGSIALVGFGFDSVIEVISGITLVWRLHSDADEARREKVEQIALKIVGASLLLLAAYVTFDSVGSLIKKEPPKESVVGIALAAVSVVVMPLLVRAKRRVARSINSAALHADAMQTQICTYLSAILLVGLLLNAVAGWWWADPVAALIMVPIIGREGFEAIRGERCEDDCAGD